MFRSTPSNDWWRVRKTIVDLRNGLESITFGSCDRVALVLVRYGPTWLGQIALPRPESSVISAEALAAALRESPVATAFGRERIRRLSEKPQDHSANPTSVDASVAIPTRDRPAQLARCLDSLAALRTKPKEVLVIDNAPSDDRTRRLCERRDVRYLVDPRPGLARAHNCAVGAATGRWIAFLDDDCVADPHWLDGLDDAFEDTRVGCVTGPVFGAGIATPAQALFEARGGWVRSYDWRVFDSRCREPLIPGWCPGANMIFRRSALTQMGGFEERLGAGTPAGAGDDVEAFYRVVAMGHRLVFDPRRAVFHENRADLDGLRTQVYANGTGAATYMLRLLLAHRDPRAVRLGLAWLLHHLPSLALTRPAIAGVPRRLIVGLAATEALGFLAGPFAYWRSFVRTRGGAY
jgi:GT2 family glycosyltransferase